MEAIAEVPVVESDPAPELAATVPAAQPKKLFESLDSVLQAMTEQDEVIKAMRTQLQDALALNATLRRSIKHIVQNAEKNDEMEQELQSARKKLSMLKSFINGAA